MHFNTLKVMVGPPQAVDEASWKDTVAGLHWIREHYPEISFVLDHRHLTRFAMVHLGECDFTVEEYKEGYAKIPRHPIDRVSSSTDALVEVLDEIDITYYNDYKNIFYFSPRKEQIPAVYHGYYAPLKRGPYFAIYGTKKQGFEVLYSQEEEQSKKSVNHFWYRIATPSLLPQPRKNPSKKKKRVFVANIEEAAYQVRINYEAGNGGVRFAEGNNF